jgi:hypothetical protein
VEEGEGIGTETVALHGNLDDHRRARLHDRRTARHLSARTDEYGDS